MIPAPAAIRALLTLKLLDKERRRHIDDFHHFDEALGLFAGWNLLPKKSFATNSSYRTTRENQLDLLRGWVPALGAVLFPAADTFALDFHPIPYRECSDFKCSFRKDLGFASDHLFEACSHFPMYSKYVDLGIVSGIAVKQAVSGG
jgi:hypothetical protein